MLKQQHYSLSNVKTTTLDEKTMKLSILVNMWVRVLDRKYYSHLTSAVTGVDCAYRFLNGKTWVHVEGCKNAQLSDCLNTIVDPEQKRRIIGDVFMHVGSICLDWNLFCPLSVPL